jgi:hypothetical protein
MSDTSTKHTPGPWYYHRQSTPNLYAEDGTQIGGANFVDDGLLIAAAPDLLAALHHISLTSQNSMSSKEECGRIAREAIAKATRGKP